jgi:hypothetical protein
MKSAENVWSDLRVHLSNGGMVTAGTGMEKAETQWFVFELKKRLGNLMQLETICALEAGVAARSTFWTKN